MMNIILTRELDYALQRNIPLQNGKRKKKDFQFLFGNGDTSERLTLILTAKSPS